MKENESYKAMLHCRPKIIRSHNIRDPKIVMSESHIDLTRPHEILLDLGSIEDSYHIIFDKAVAEYNSKMTRKDRMINDYLDKILSDSRRGKHKNFTADGSRKAAYEMIIQLGNRDNQPDNELTCTVLKDFANHIAEKYKNNIYPIGIVLHNDEFSFDDKTGNKIPSPPHVHFDFVYIAHVGKSLKTGMEIQSSMSGALRELGFKTEKKRTAQIQFEEFLRHELQDYAEERGIPIDRTPGERHSHKEKPVYQQMKENKKIYEDILVEQQTLEMMNSELQTKDELLKQERELLNDMNQSNFENFTRIESQLLQREENLKRKELEFSRLDLKIQSYKDIDKAVRKENLRIDEEVDAFFKDTSIPLKNRMDVFIKKVKKIVTAIVTELNFYKKTFKSFFRKTPKDFRDIAKQMEINKCSNFKEYTSKLFNGQQIKKENISISNDSEIDM